MKKWATLGVIAIMLGLVGLEVYQHVWKKRPYDTYKGYAVRCVEPIECDKVIMQNIREGVDAFQERWPSAGLTKVKVEVVKHPIMVNWMGKAHPANGLTHTPDKIFVTRMDDRSMKSIVVHESAHLLKYKQGDRDADPLHTDKEFWALADRWP